MKILVRKIVFVLFLAASFSAFALGVETAYVDVFSGNSSNITRVSTCGEWRSKTRAGQFRIIELFKYGMSYLYVDRVADNASRTGMEIINGIGIKEFNNDHAEYTLSNVICKPSKNGISIWAVAESGHDNSVKKIVIEVKANDSYSIKGLQ